MNTERHDIRLLAGFEVAPESIAERVLSREQVAELASALADDLARAVPGVEQAVLIAAGSLLEPAEMLRPGLPVWAAMADLAAPVIRERNMVSGVFAVGSHQKRLPDRRLAPPTQQAQGRFIAVPLLLAADAESGPMLEQRLERELFDQASIAPPARALLERFTGADSVHGQLLTLNDLLAIQHVQMDAAGLSAFWSVIEHILLAPESNADFTLPAGVRAHWDAGSAQLDIFFVVFDRYDAAPEDYVVWQRGFRTLSTLADAHGMTWQARFDDDLVLDETSQTLTQHVGTGPADDALTEHNDPALGLVAWTVVEDGRLRHIYPLSAGAISACRHQLLARFNTVTSPDRLCYSGDPPRLQAA